MAEVKQKTPVEAKELSKTDLFKAHLQKIVKDVTGNRISKSAAWDLFKDIIAGTVEFVENQPLEKADGEDNLGTRRLPLAGVGSFEILNVKPRGTKAGLRKNEAGEWVPDESLKVWDYVPRFRFYASSKISERLEQVFGLEDHGAEIKHYGLYRQGDAEPAKGGDTEEETPEEPSKDPDLDTDIL
jgi:hypothetical protein